MLAEWVRDLDYQTTELDYNAAGRMSPAAKFTDGNVQIGHW